MLGFQEGAPVFVKVSWAGAEVEMVDGQQETYGLRASTKVGSQVTKWFVPWSAVSYIKQDLPTVAPSAAPATLPPAAPPGAPTDHE